MKIQRTNITTDFNDNGELRSGAIYFENSNDLGERVSGQIVLTLKQWEAIQKQEITASSIVEHRLIELLQIGIEEDDNARFVAIEGQLYERANEMVQLAVIVDEIVPQAEQAAEIAASKTAGRALTELRDEMATIRQAARKLVRIDDLTPDDIADLVALYEIWEPTQEVKSGATRSHNGKLYKVVQAHITQEDWTPDATPALWVEIAPAATEEAEEIVPEWVQPTGAHDAHKVGDKVLYNGKVYRSLIGANTWSPIEYPQGWKEVAV